LDVELVIIQHTTFLY